MNILYIYIYTATLTHSHATARHTHRHMQTLSFSSFSSLFITIIASQSKATTDHPRTTVANPFFLSVLSVVRKKERNGRIHPARCTPLHQQSEQTTADIQQGAPLTQAKRANCRGHPAKCPLYTSQNERLAADIQQSAPLYTTKARKRPQTSSKVRPSTPAKRANGRRHPAKCALYTDAAAPEITPSAPHYTSQSAQTDADIQQSAPL